MKIISCLVDENTPMLEENIKDTDDQSLPDVILMTFNTEAGLDIFNSKYAYLLL